MPGTKTLKLPTKIGTPYGGGHYAGVLFINGKPHIQIAAPRAEGEFAGVVWNANGKPVSGAVSYCDGLANTKAMARAGSALAKRILALRIGGHKDWHLPSRLQALVMRCELSPLKAFQEGSKDGFDRAWYWTSSRHAEYSDYAWYQSFNYGSQNYLYHGYSLRARAVRTIAI